MPKRQTPQLNAEDQQDWSKAVEEKYGVRISPEQFYLDSRGYIMAGSEYIAQPFGYSVKPWHSSFWSDSLNHFVSGTGRLETSERKDG